MIELEPHPLLDTRAFVVEYAAPLSKVESPEWLVSALSSDSTEVTLKPTDEIRGAVRDMLRHGGYKPTGRGKPASEYLARAAGEGGISRINVAVDLANAVSLHSGLPISLVDADAASAPFAIRVAPADATYVFNASGQEMSLGGIPCLYDARGPCANAVKDSQRTKTHPGTLRTIAVIWGARRVAYRTNEALALYQAFLRRLGLELQLV